MAKIVLYENDGGVAFVIPSGELAIEEVAKKDVPAGKQYWIVEDSVLPQDREFRDAWELDTNALGEAHGTAIGADAWFAGQEQNND